MTGEPKLDMENAVYAQDEYGRPVVIIREQGKTNRMCGIEAHKVSSLFYFYI